MAKPHDKPGVTTRYSRLRATHLEVRPGRLTQLWAGLAMTLCAGGALAQSAGQIPLAPSPQNTDAQEQRRAQDRDRAQRERQERDVDVRLSGQPEAAPALLPEGEAPCFVIRELDLRVPGGERPGTVAQFRGFLDAASGFDHQNSPIGRCLGAEGVSLVIKRVQNAVIARGFVTTRVLAEPQDLSSGTLILTLIPGRIRAIRFAEGSDRRGNAWSALPASAGDLLNLRDIEQALENFKRVPTAEADIQIEPASGPAAQPGQSDLVISYRQPFPFRLSLSADDSGAKATGKYQGGVTLSYDNWWTLNDLFYVSLNRDLGGGVGADGERGTFGNTVHYSVPLGYWLVGTTGSNNSYRQSIAGATQTYVYKGTSSNLELKVSRLVYRDAARKTTLALRAFQRSSNNFIDDTEIEVQRRRVGGFEASVSHREFLGAGTLDANLAYKRGTGAFGSLPAPEEAFDEGTSRLRITTADLSFNTPLKAFDQRLRYTGVLRAQLNHTRLTPQDRFAIGGRYTVRGFDGESSLSAERGWLLRNELSAAVGSSGQEVYAGLDYGRVGGPSSEFLIGQSLAGAVLGLRGGHKALQYDVFVGKPVSKPAGFKTASVTAGFSLNYSF
jgi:hemolysin activation/secretion protein